MRTIVLHIVVGMLCVSTNVLVRASDTTIQEGGDAVLAQRAQESLERVRGMKAAVSDMIFFETANMKVTSTRFETSFESFPIKRISAVRIDAEKRKTRIGLPLVFVGVTSLLAGALSNLPVLIVAGAAFTVGGAILCVARVTSSVVITSRGRDVTVYTSKDAALIHAITNALLEALARRQ